MASARQNAADLWIGGGVLVLCAFAAWRTLQIKTVASATVAGPSFVPWLLIAGVSGLALGLLGRGLWRMRSDHEPRDDGDAVFVGLPRIGAFVVLLVAYAAAFYPVGYIPSTLVAFVVGLWLIGERRLPVLLGFPVLMTFAVYFGFTQLLSVWLP